MADQRQGDMTGDHEHDQDPAVAGDAAQLLERLRAALDPPGRLDMDEKRAAWRLRRAAELARERAAEIERPESEADRRE